MSDTTAGGIQRAAPDVSVVVVTDCAETMAEVLRHIRAQTIHERVELVIPTPKPDDVMLGDLAVNDLAAVQVVKIEAITPISAARAAGVRAASAPFVFLGETHSFPEPHMLEYLVEAHRAGWDRVAPVFENANPRNALSWAAFLLDYGVYAGPVASGEANVPIYNCSYRRSMLLQFGASLESLIESGSSLNDDIRTRGFRSCRVGNARITHTNVATTRPFLRQRYLLGRNIGARLSRHWPARRRVLYILGSPLIPPLLALRTLRASAMRDRVRAAPRFTLAAMLLSFALRGMGEAIGYAVGSGATADELDQMEIHKLRYA